MQVVFEGLGAIVLRQLDIGLRKHGQRFAPLRRVLLRRKTRIMNSAVRSLQRLVGLADERAGLRTACVEYCELNNAILHACSELFGDFDAEIAEYIE